MRTEIGIKPDPSTKKQIEQSNLSMETYRETFLRGFPIVIKVTQEFLTYRDKMYATGGFSSLKNCDFLLFEWYLLQEGFTPPNNWCHDVILPFFNFVDVKHVNTQYFSIDTEKKFYQFVNSIDTGQLNYFFFYTSFPHFKRSYVLGDMITIEGLDFKDAKETLDETSRSIHDSSYRYYRPQKYVLPAKV